MEEFTALEQTLIAKMKEKGIEVFAITDYADEENQIAYIHFEKKASEKGNIYFRIGLSHHRNKRSFELTDEVLEKNTKSNRMVSLANMNIRLNYFVMYAESFLSLYQDVKQTLYQTLQEDKTERIHLLLNEEKAIIDMVECTVEEMQEEKVRRGMNHGE